MSFFANLEAWFNGDVVPFLKSFVASETKALAPIATAAVSTLAVEEAQAVAAGGANTGHVLAQVVNDTAAKAAQAGIAAGSTAILTAVGNAVQVKAAGG